MTCETFIVFHFLKAGLQLHPLCRGGWTRSQTAGDLDSVWPARASLGPHRTLTLFPSNELPPVPASPSSPTAGALSVSSVGVSSVLLHLFRAPPHQSAPRSRWLWPSWVNRPKRGGSRGWPFTGQIPEQWELRVPGTGRRLSKCSELRGCLSSTRMVPE